MRKILHLRVSITALFAITFLATTAQVPTGYYSSIMGKKDAELKTALHNLLYNHTEISSYWDLPSKYFRYTDAYPVGNDRYGQWWDMYGNIPLYLPSFSGMNREHSFPKSWWGGSENTPAYIDLNHLYPSEANANMAKSNYPLGEVQTPTFDNGVTRVGTPVSGQGGGARQVFEPDDEYKGDFARTYFYMVTCYQNLTWKYTYMVNNNTYPTLNNWSVELLLKWHRQDPPSQKEIDRNNEVYKFQANRNPFIDYKDLAEYIWGNRKGQPFYPTDGSDEETGDPVLITPVQDMSLDFGEVAIGTQGEASLQFRGENITTNTTLMITGADRALFTPEVTTISPSAINSPSGLWVKIKYNPTTLGTHTARLIVSDYGVGSRGIELRGECLEQPNLRDFRALPATDINPNGYTAHWEVPVQNAPNEIVEYYVVTRTIIDGTASDPVQITEVAESNLLVVNDHEAGTAESYHVQSSRLGFLSAPTNEISVDFTGGIGGVSTEMPMGVVYEPGGLRFVCGGTLTNVTVYDTSGRVIIFCDSIYNGDIITLPSGIYLITADEHPTPIKAVVRE